MNTSTAPPLIDPEDLAPIERYVIGRHSATMAESAPDRFYIREVATGAIVARQLTSEHARSRYCVLAGIARADFECRRHRPSEHCGNCA